jgi:hypothetical protein
VNTFTAPAVQPLRIAWKRARNGSGRYAPMAQWGHGRMTADVLLIGADDAMDRLYKRRQVVNPLIARVSDQVSGASCR